MHGNKEQGFYNKRLHLLLVMTCGWLLVVKKKGRVGHDVLLVAFKYWRMPIDEKVNLFGRKTSLEFDG